MFEDICLLCGKPLTDDAAYCSDDCQGSDLASPSISSSSSALSSPSLGYAQGLADIPPLMPTALGGSYQTREPYYVQSSRYPSNPWLPTDDDDYNGAFSRSREYLGDSVFEGSSKSANYIHNMMPPSLSYARRPSGTNTHPSVPRLHQHNSSGLSPAPRNRDPRGASRSVPNHPHSSTDDEDFSDFSISSRKNYADDADSDKDWHGSQCSGAKSRRNRASLPACFSLLQIQTSASPSPREAVKASPVSSSSARTIARPSPPTPKCLLGPQALSKWQSPRPSPSLISSDMSRGRRDRSSRRSDRSSPSPSRSRPRPPRQSPRVIVPTYRSDLKTTAEHAFDWDNDLPRGRASARRDTSPPPRMLMGVDNPGRVLRDGSHSNSKSRSRRGRGRVGVDELEGVGSFALAPGYGNGRSGLMDRERFSAARVPL